MAEADGQGRGYASKIPSRHAGIFTRNTGKLFFQFCTSRWRHLENWINCDMKLSLYGRTEDKFEKFKVTVRLNFGLWGRQKVIEFVHRLEQRNEKLQQREYSLLRIKTLVRVFRDWLISIFPMLELRWEENRQCVQTKRQINVENCVRPLMSSVRQQLVGAGVERKLIDQLSTSMGFGGRIVAMIEQELFYHQKISSLQTSRRRARQWGAVLWPSTSCRFWECGACW